jgi:hypothetical protein
VNAVSKKDLDDAIGREASARAAVPSDYRGEGPDIPKQPAEVSFGDLKWF